VVPIDKFLSNVTCSSRHKRLKKARLFTKMQRREDEVDIRTKGELYKKEAKEIAEMRKFRNLKFASNKVELKCTRNVLRCANSSCRANVWNRDVNAARNILELLCARLLGFERIPEFAR